MIRRKPKHTALIPEARTIGLDHVVPRGVAPPPSTLPRVPLAGTHSEVFESWRIWRMVTRDPELKRALTRVKLYDGVHYEASEDYQPIAP